MPVKRKKTNSSENAGNSENSNNVKPKKVAKKTTTKATKTAKATKTVKATKATKTAKAVKAESRSVSRSTSRSVSRSKSKSKSSSNIIQIKNSNTNNLLKNMSKKYKFHDDRSRNPKFNTIDEYEASFNEIIRFSNEFTPAQKKQINLVIFHDENDDGFVSAYSAWKHNYKDSNSRNNSFALMAMKPASGNRVDNRLERQANSIRGKHVLIVDLDYNDINLDYIKSLAASMIVIDDHHSERNRNDFYDNNIYKGKIHSASAYTWKFFYPTSPTPSIIHYIDNSDRKLNLPFAPYSAFFSLFMGIRYSHNKYMTITKKTDVESGLMTDLDDNVMNDHGTFWVLAGKYYHEFRENIKHQIAVNAQLANFQGYRVAVLNFNAPALSKVVALQILTNMESSHQNIDFVVLWGYEYTSNSYRVQLSQKHFKNSTTIRLNEIARTLGQRGGHPKGGGGPPTGWEGNFYWPRKANQDIWDLFEKQYL